MTNPDHERSLGVLRAFLETCNMMTYDEISRQLKQKLSANPTLKSKAKIVIPRVRVFGIPVEMHDETSVEVRVPNE